MFVSLAIPSLLGALALSARAAVVLDKRAVPSAADVASSLAACKQIAGNVSSASGVFYPVTAQYAQDIVGYSLINTAVSTCVFEAGSEQDVAVALKVLGSTKAPFAVRSGGHGTNPGTSSTTGVHISLKRFGTTTYSNGIAAVGMGQIWDNVYKTLDPLGVSVLGGRVAGVGVGGYTLGGGYGYRTNQYGLTIDTVDSWRLVLPNGTITTVQNDDSDLSFMLKGGQNNVGIVTTAYLKTHPGGKVWGGANAYATGPEVLTACSNFDVRNTDKKAALLCDYIPIITGSTPFILLIAFYDGATPPAGPFDEIRKLVPIGGVSQFKTFDGMASFTGSIPANLAGGLRTSYNSISIQNFTPAMVTAVQAVSAKYGIAATLNTGILLNINPEPFVASAMFANSKGGVYPHDPAKPYKPLEINLAWIDPLSDAFFFDLSKKIASELTAAAKADGQTTGETYVNYALGDAPLDQIYGSNVARAKAIVAKVDPNKVMSRCGGVRFQ